MLWSHIIAFASLIVSTLSVLATVYVTWYKTVKTQNFEKEKIKLNLFSDFISYCTKKTAGVITTEDTIDFTNAYVKLMLVSDSETNVVLEKLYNTVSSDNKHESIKLLDEATQLMWSELKTFNKKR